MNIFRDKIVKTYYISALRGEIPRKENSRGKPEWFGVHGENVIKLLALIYGSREYNEIQKNIIKWAYELEVADLHAGWAGNEILGCDYKDPKLDTILDLQFSGFGSKQIIPVIVQLFYSPSDSIIMVEEPEISLHPDAQTKLPEMFLEAINNGKQVIITTHSEHLLLALKPLIASGKLNHDDVALYHFEKTDMGSVAKRLEITDQGIVSGWVPSFMEVELALIRDWAKSLPEISE